MGPSLRSEHPEQVEDNQFDSEIESTIELRTIIAREGSDLAELLRGRGWVVRSGWRGVTDTGDSVWNLRFETPEDADTAMSEHPA